MSRSSLNTRTSDQSVPEIDIEESIVDFMVNGTPLPDSGAHIRQFHIPLDVDVEEVFTFCRNPNCHHASIASVAVATREVRTVTYFHVGDGFVCRGCMEDPELMVSTCHCCFRNVINPQEPKGAGKYSFLCNRCVRIAVQFHYGGLDHKAKYVLAQCRMAQCVKESTETVRSDWEQLREQLVDAVADDIDSALFPPFPTFAPFGEIKMVDSPSGDGQLDIVCRMCAKPGAQIDCKECLCGPFCISCASLGLFDFGSDLWFHTSCPQCALPKVTPRLVTLADVKTGKSLPIRPPPSKTDEFITELIIGSRVFFQPSDQELAPAFDAVASASSLHDALSLLSDFFKFARRNSGDHTRVYGLSTAQAIQMIKHLENYFGQDPDKHKIYNFSVAACLLPWKLPSGVASHGLCYRGNFGETPNGLVNALKLLSKNFFDVNQFDFNEF